MARQVTKHRLVSGLGHGITVAAKSGGLLGATSNEVGVISHPGGARYARRRSPALTTPEPRDAAINTAIGTAAAAAVRRVAGYR